jgi:hypothetical protein
MNNLFILEDFNSGHGLDEDIKDKYHTEEEIIEICRKKGYNSFIRQGKGQFYIRPNDNKFNHKRIIKEYKEYINKGIINKRFKNIKVYLIDINPKLL